VGKSGVSHLASIVLARDTSGHSLAFFEKYRLVRFAADGGMRKADAMIRQLILESDAPHCLINSSIASGVRSGVA
jgi:hypothetical protein